MINPEEVAERVAAIAKMAKDPEAAHLEEDELYKDVLKAIANGCINPSKMASEALLAGDVEFDRWYA